MRLFGVLSNMVRRLQYYWSFRMFPSFWWRSRTRHRPRSLVCRMSSFLHQQIAVFFFFVVLPHCSWAALVPRTWPVLRSWNRRGGEIWRAEWLKLKGKEQSYFEHHQYLPLLYTLGHTTYAFHHLPCEHLYGLIRRQWEERILSQAYLSTAAVRPEVVSTLMPFTTGSFKEKEMYTVHSHRELKRNI